MREPQPIVECQMLIRRPQAEVFEAFINPSQTTNFWFTKSTGELKAGSQVLWTWDMYDFTTEVKVVGFVEQELIAVVWGELAENIDFTFRPSADGTATYVVIRNYGFAQTGAALQQKLIDTTGGFTTVLDGAKCWLEKGLKLNLIEDKFPKEFINH